MGAPVEPDAAGTAIARAEPAPVPAPRPPQPPVLDEATRQAQLDRMKRRASGLLVVAAAIFLTTSYFEPQLAWLGYLRATAEAAVIGGLADWFAVTALFRHPLGIPIPHTAIVPTRKDRLGRTLGNFVQNHFLSREVLTERLSSLRLAERMASWISQPENARMVSKQVAAGLAKTVAALPDDEIKQLVHSGLVNRLRATQVAPLLGSVLSLVRAGNRHQELLSEVIRLAAAAVDENRESIRHNVKQQSPWWVPGIIDDKIYRKILIAIQTMLHELGADPDHPLRAKFDASLESFVDRLQHSPDTIAKAESLKEQFLADPVVEEFAAWLWNLVRGAALGEAAKGDAATPGAIERGITSFAGSLVGNQALLDKIDAFAIERILSAVEQYRGEVADLIATTVAKWDPQVTSRRIELAIGRDLQFIRINGTLVGGLLGLLIYTVTQLLR